ncbi:hypothetical protein [Pedobacter sp. UYP1]|uniref:hypothetical protein n=1 Tax=Pedobacter sp. UYP1 TaxID=1756396 RepID=UPI00339623CE
MYEVDIVTEGPKKPDVPDPLGPPSPDPNTVDSWPIEPINEVGGSDGNVIAPPIIITIDIRMKYPTLAKIIDGLYQKAISNPKLMAALKQFSHLSEQQILDNLKSGKGPSIQVVDPNSLIGGSVGEFDPISGIIKISETVASDANYFSTATLQQQNFILLYVFYMNLYITEKILLRYSFLMKVIATMLDSSLKTNFMEAALVSIR